MNAHALLQAGSDLAGQPESGHLAAGWRRERCWPYTLYHPMVFSARPSSNAVDVLFNPAAASMSWIRDHHVQGRCLVPGAALFELAGATIAACAREQVASTLHGAAILEPLVLGSSISEWVHCRTELRPGELVISSASGRKHLVTSASCVACLPGPAQRTWPGALHALARPSAQHPAKVPHNFGALELDRQRTSG